MPKKLEKVNVAKCRTCTHGNRCLEIAKYGKITIMNCRHYSPKEYNFEFEFLPGNGAYVLANDGLSYFHVVIQSICVAPDFEVRYVFSIGDDGAYITDAEYGISAFHSEDEAQKKVQSNLRKLKRGM